MDSTISAILSGVGAVVASVLISLAVQIKGRNDTAKDARKVELEQERQRNESEAAFRRAFAEVSAKNERLEKRIEALTDERTRDAATVTKLEAELRDSVKRFDTISASNKLLTENLARTEHERDVAVQGETKARLDYVAANQDRERLEALLEKQTYEMTTIKNTLSEQEKQLEAQAVQIKELETRLSKQEAKPDTGKLDPTHVPDAPPQETIESKP